MNTQQVEIVVLLMSCDVVVVNVVVVPHFSVRLLVRFVLLTFYAVVHVIVIILQDVDNEVHGVAFEMCGEMPGDIK
jgi:putative ribosome biogenesis GTPase RsgA